MTETLPPVDARRYRPDALVLFAIALLEAAGLPAERARAVAEILVEGDLLGPALVGLRVVSHDATLVELGEASVGRGTCRQPGTRAVDREVGFGVGVVVGVDDRDGPACTCHLRRQPVRILDLARG